MNHQGKKTARSEIFGFFDSFKPREVLTVSEWAEKYRYLEKGSTSKPGRYSFDAGPYQREPQESYTDLSVQVTVLQWASRTGKTETLNNLDGYIIDHDPKAILVVYPTLDSATKWRKEFFNPMVRATPRLRGKINIKARHADNTMLSMKFPGGHIAAIGTNSPSGFRQIQAPVVRCDEVDAMEDGKEGDPISLAFRRADNYPDSIQVISSTPTVKGYSRIEKWMERSDYRMWFCPCVKCGFFQVLKWEGVRWEDDAETEARYLCESKDCEHPHNDAERREMVINSEWRPTRPFKGIRGYFLSGLNTLFPAKKGFANKLHQFVSEYLEATNGGKPTMRTWKNTFLAETDDAMDKSETPPVWRTLFDRREDYEIVPQGGLILTCFVDVQVNRLEVGWTAHGRNGESWGLAHVVIDGNTKDMDIWKIGLCGELKRKFKHELGGEMSLDMCFIDGGWASEYVYAFLQWLARNPVDGVTGKVRASKGLGQHGHPIIDPRWRTIAKNLKGYHLGTWEAKDLINQRLRMTKNEDGTFPDGYMHFNKGYGEVFFQQICTGIVSIMFEKGEEVRKFLNEGKFKDEALDISVGNLAIFRRQQWSFDVKKAALTVAHEPGGVIIDASAGVPSHSGWSITKPGKKWL